MSARADIVGIVSGSGFRDRTPVAPVGGNPGTTLGEQRRLALERAFERWEDWLDSQVTIEVAFELEELGCGDGGVILGSAGPANAYREVPGGDPALYYVSALANSLAGRDIDPEEPDIVAQFNSSVDGECSAAVGGFYYGFDGRAAGAVDFVQVVMHELGHGLGITSLVDTETGELLIDAPDSYTARIHDLTLDRAWPALTTAERAESAQNVRNVVWDGPAATQLVPQVFGRGRPSLTLEPAVSGYNGLVADVGFATNPSASPVRADLTAAKGCRTGSEVAGKIALFAPGCQPLAAAQSAARSGASGALVVSGSPVASPPMPLDDEPDNPTKVALPVLSITGDDAQLLQRALTRGTLRATLGGEASGYIGADDQQRPLLFASRPVSRGSTISHLEELVRPSQLMEPFASTDATGSLAFTAAMLRDIGWPLLCGNGQLDSGEQCDDGDDNSDVKADACRTHCKPASCGDGVRDSKEACDDGQQSSDTLPDSCRTRCEPAGCGDGVVDQGEQCDRGAANSDSAPDACRADCHLPRCGDGVIDALETCDDGPANSDEAPNACRTSCRSAGCGDGVIDRGESCDAGRRNSTAADSSCRPDCAAPRCGDGVIDEGEDCDGAAGCTDTCQRPKRDAQRAADEAEPDSEIDKTPRAESRPAASGCQVLRASTAPGHRPWVVGLSLVLFTLAKRRRQRSRAALTSPARLNEHAGCC